MTDAHSVYLASFDRITTATGDETAFFDRFYENFIATSSEIALKFMHTNMPVQQQMLRRSVVHMLDMYTHRSPSTYLTTIATRHNKDHADVPPRLYDAWVKALVQTAGELDPQFDARVRAAWLEVYSPGLAYMKVTYNVS